MGVVYRATQLALQRPVALKAIAPELAADTDYRERFERESHLAASLDHPNVIPVYEAGERDGTLYLIMRWVQGTDLQAVLRSSGRVSPGRAIRLLRPVAAALAAAHRRGLIHRDVKPANVLIAGTDEDPEEQIYLTDFGIARLTDGESITRTGMFVGTIDYTAPERIEGERGYAPSDIYSFGCMLFESLTGHVPFERPSDVAKIFAHINDPIPSARAEVAGVPEQLDAIITKAMAKRPEDRFGSAGELIVALDQVLKELDTAERVAAAPKAQADVTEISESATAIKPVGSSVPAAETAKSGTESWEALSELATRGTEATEGVTELAKPGTDATEGVTELAKPGTGSTEGATELAKAGAGSTEGATELAKPGTAPTEGMTELAKPRTEARDAVAQRASPAPPAPTEPLKRPVPPSRRFPTKWAVALVGLVVVAGVLVAVLSGGGGSSSSSNSAGIQITGSGLTEGQSIDLSSAPGSISIGSKNVWISLPGSGKLVRFNPATGSQQSFAATGSPTAIVAGPAALWVAQTASKSLAQFNGDSGKQVAAAKLPGAPTSVALDQNNSTAWVSDSSGAITHVVFNGAVSGKAAQINPAAKGIGWGEGWIWAANGADSNDLVRVSLGGDGSTKAFDGGPGGVAVTFDDGVWIAHANGHVTRFDPRSNHLKVNADVGIAPDLAGIAAIDPSPYVWAISRSAKTLYRITNTSQPAVTGKVVFASSPVALAVRGSSVWVATEDGRVVEIRF
jgi:Protein kinase domain